MTHRRWASTVRAWPHASVWLPDIGIYWPTFPSKTAGSLKAWIDRALAPTATKSLATAGAE